MRLLVLAGAGLMVPDAAIVAVESAEEQEQEQGERAQPRPWLPAMIGHGLASAPGNSRRVLYLTNGGRVEVPSDMRIVDGIEVLALPDLLRTIGERVGIVGFAPLADELLLVCDPNLLAGSQGSRGEGGRPP